MTFLSDRTDRVAHRTFRPASETNREGFECNMMLDFNSRIHGSERLQHIRVKTFSIRLGIQSNCSNDKWTSSVYWQSEIFESVDVGNGERSA